MCQEVFYFFDMLPPKSLQILSGRLVSCPGIVPNVRGLGEGRLSFLSFRPSRTTNIFLFNGEANTLQAFAKPMLYAGHYLDCITSLMAVEISF